MSRVKLSLPCGDRANPCPPARGQRNNLISWSHDASSNLACKSAEILMRTDHTLHGEPQTSLRPFNRQRNRFKQFEQAQAAIPWGPFTTMHNVVALKGANWNRNQFGNFEFLCQRLQIATVALEDFLREPDHIHLVNGRDHQGNP